jgi:hypothetical protein
MAGRRLRRRADVEDLIKGKYLLIVPAGPLTSLPLNVLVTRPPKTAIPDKVAGYREVAWLGARQPVSVLPSVASLRTLRQFAKVSRATKPYLGIGNPLLDGPQDHPQWGAHYKNQAQAARAKQQCPNTLALRRARLVERPCTSWRFHLPAKHPTACDPARSGVQQRARSAPWCRGRSSPSA